MYSKLTRNWFGCLLGGLLLLGGCASPQPDYPQQIRELLRDPILERAPDRLSEPPITITAFSCERSAGGIHDFYSEGDYWWPDTTDPEGPYVRRDGMTNPENFTAHREVLIRFSEMVGLLTSAYLLTDDPRYAQAALAHCRAWFLTDSTRMSPHLLYAQAIKGRHTGRGIGIIDAIHFMEVVQSLQVLATQGQINSAEMAGFRRWVANFLTWLTTHPYGLDEMVHPNNHGSWWNAQVGLYANFVGADSIAAACRDRFTSDLLPRQMAQDGSFPLELERTKPYAYSLFNLDAFAMIGLILSNEEHDLWAFGTPEGKSIRLGLEFMAPYLADKSTWPYPRDVMHAADWPVAQPSFWLGAVVFERAGYYQVWAPFEHFPEVFEVKRAQPIKNPLIWLETL
ncbi:MAG: alginate lyase family protein [Bacteroidota bacterium]